MAVSDLNSLQPRFVDVPGKGKCLLPSEFALFTGEIDTAELHDAQESPQQLLGRLAAGAAIVLTGPYPYINGVFRYCQHFERGLVESGKFSHISDRGQRSAAFTTERRQKLHRLLLMARGDSLIDVQDPPETAGLQEWLQEPIGEIFLIPVRRLQRILTDMRRAQEGIPMEILDGVITILPHVYVPADQSVPAMFKECRHLMEGKRVLDMGTGTGVLALLAARLGAARVLATDSNPNAVANARLNAERLNLADIVEVRGPADLFDSVQGETFHLILFNAPWIQGEPKTLYDTANYDPGYRVLDAFLQGTTSHLTQDGAILLQYSDVSQRKGEDSMTHLKETIAANGLRIVGEQSIARVGRVLGTRERVFLFEIRRNGDQGYE
ncbi:50S ribosomal protein L11 methyltransferase [Candidatus Poribacteria bacterium]